MALVTQSDSEMRYSVIIVCCLGLASAQDRPRRRIKKKIIVQSEDPAEEARLEPPVHEKTDIQLKPKEPRG